MPYILGIVAGSGVILLAIALLIIGRALGNVTPSLIAYGKTTVEAIKGQALAEAERDEWKTKAVKAIKENDLLKEQGERISAHLTELQEKEAHDRVEEIRHADSAVSALDMFNRILQNVPRLSTSPAGSKTSGSDNDNTGSPSVPPT